jgi:hypothetical protein
MTGKFTMVLASCCVFSATIVGVRAMPGVFGQRTANPDLLEAAVTTPTVHTTTPSITTTKPNVTTGPHGITPRHGTAPKLDKKATGHKTNPNGIGPADPLANDAAKK